MEKIAIVTGGSGGIGRCTAAALRDAGCRVYEFSRHEKPAAGIIHLTADMTDESQVKAAVKEVLAREGRIDILVNNAGFGISGAAELTDSRDAHDQLELNLYGMDNATKAVLPAMREALHAPISYLPRTCRRTSARPSSRHSMTGRPSPSTTSTRKDGDPCASTPSGHTSVPSNSPNNALWTN